MIIRTGLIQSVWVGREKIYKEKKMSEKWIMMEINQLN